MIGRGDLRSARPLATGFVPPAPKPPARDLSGPQLLLAGRRNNLRIWPARAYTELLVHRRFLGTDCYLINDPTAARHVLSESGVSYVRPISVKRLLLPGTGSGLLTAEGAEWRQQRRMLAPAFAPRQVESLIPRFAAAATNMANRLAGASRVRLGEVLAQAAIDVAGRTMLSMSLAAQADRLGGLLRSYFNGAARAQIFDFMARSESDYRWFTIRRRTFSRRWFAAIDALIAQRRQRGPAGSGSSDLFDLLASARNPLSGAPLDDVEIRDQIGSMLAAGFETTARAMFWAVYLLAHASDWQAAIRRELREFPPAALTSMDGLEQWPSLRAVLLEALRLYPPTPIVSRLALADHMILESPIRAGSLVIICPWVMHRHRALWEVPEEFRPERFVGDPHPYLSQPAYIPFGGGPRSCPGGAFAMTEATIVLAHLLARFEISMEKGRPVMPVAIVTTAPNHEPWFRLQPC
jgi:cytochrome P450